MPTKLAILHYNILEKYPPTMNFIQDLEESEKEFILNVISTKNNTTYTNFTTSIGSVIRLGAISQGSLARYLSYLIFNLGSLLRLIFFKPQEIAVFETLSIWPAYFYKKINKKVNIHVHHHEYASLQELEVSSVYFKFLHRKEKLLFKRATFSHTNEDRKEMYLKDHPYLVAANVEVYPNLPPQSWWYEFGSKKIAWQGPKIKLVYVGALDLDTMYVKEVVEWVLSNPDLLQLTFISQQMNTDTLLYIQSKIGSEIKILKPINYEYLPSELINHDIGISLYKGVNKNHIYGVPNKVYEYLYCGLKVLGDNCLKSTSKLGHSDIYLADLKHGIEISKILPFVERQFQFELKRNYYLSQKYN